MKKFIAIALSIVSVFAVSVFSACGDKADGTTLTVYAPDGAPALSVAKFINDKEDFGTELTVNYNVVAASNIGTVMAQGTGDIIIMPVNAASKLYAANTSDKYKMAGVITHGNLYIMSKENLTLQGLTGKVVGVIGQGNVPDLTFKAVLNKNGIEYEVSDTEVSGKVALRYFADGSEIIPALRQSSITVGLVPEPAANKLTNLDGSYRYALDLQELYDAEAKAYPQAVVMVKSSILNKYPDLITDFGGKIAGAVSWAKENVALAVGAVDSVLENGLTASLSAANLNDTVIDNCKISWQSAADAKAAVQAYINDIISVEPQAAKAVPDEFFA